jgi:hypothetical protein
MNTDKITGIFNGKSKEKTSKFKDIKFTRNYVKILGICHGYNIDTNEIWMKKINKIKKLPSSMESSGGGLLS